MWLRVSVGAVAVAPFALLLLAMLTGRARVDACCGRPRVSDLEGVTTDESGQNTQLGSVEDSTRT